MDNQVKTIYVTVDYSQPMNESALASLKHQAQKLNAIIKDQAGKILFRPTPKGV
jgi:hypothetical protein